MSKGEKMTTVDWECTKCPWFINNKCTNYQEENSFCQWEEYEKDEGAE